MIVKWMESFLRLWIGRNLNSVIYFSILFFLTKEFLRVRMTQANINFELLESSFLCSADFYPPPLPKKKSLRAIPTQTILSDQVSLPDINMNSFSLERPPIHMHPHSVTASGI